MKQMDPDAIAWLARWSGIAGRDGLTLRPDGDGWRLDPLPTPGTTSDAQVTTLSDDVQRLPDGRVSLRQMTREEVEAFFGPADGPI